MRLAWAAGGGRLAYSQPGGGGHQFGVHVYDVRRGQQTTLDTLSGLKRVQGFSWSADGRWLLLTARGQTGVLDVYTYDTQQAAPRRVDLTARLEGDSAWIHPRWSPTAPRVVFRYTHDNKQNLFLAAATDGTVQQLTHLPSADYMTAHWSPDGKWIAAGVRQRGGCEVRIIDPDTATLRYKLDFTQTKPICDIAFQVRWLLP
jgi:Tol biopolymer transport system component